MSLMHVCACNFTHKPILVIVPLHTKNKYLNMFMWMILVEHHDVIDMIEDICTN